MSICASCARKFGSCCIGRDIVLTRGDVTRIGAVAGSLDFVELRRPSDPSYLDQDDDPNWNLYTVGPDGRRRVMKLNGSPDCVFLGPQGCTLGWEVKPLICRLFPVSYTEEGITGIEEECADKFPHLDTGQLIREIGMDLQAAERWRRQLYRELREDYAEDRSPRSA